MQLCERVTAETERRPALSTVRGRVDAAVGEPREQPVAVVREPVAHSPWSRGFYVRDPDGRRIEITYDNRGIYWLE